MSNHHHVRTIAQAEARDLFEQLTGSNRRDRAAFALGYILAVEAMAPHLPPPELTRQLHRARALHTLSGKEFR